jgi:hypothetical protein
VHLKYIFYDVLTIANNRYKLALLFWIAQNCDLNLMVLLYGMIIFFGVSLLEC